MHATVEPVAEAWDRLAERTGAPPFLRPGWFAAWYPAFARGRPLVLSLEGDAGPGAVGAFESVRGVLRSATNWHTPEWDVVAAGSTEARLLADAVFARRPRRVELRFLDREGLAYGAFRAAADAAGYRLLTRTLERSPYIEIADPDGRLAPKVAKDLDRRRRRLAEAEGPVSLEAADGGGDLDELLAEGFRLEASGWKAERGTAIVSRPETRDFYARLARWAAERGFLRLYFLRAGDSRVAFDFVLADERREYDLKGGYDVGRRAFAPRKLLVREIVRHLAGTGRSSYELLGEAEPWKLEWTELLRERLILQAFAPTAAGRADWAAYRVVRPAAKRVLAAAGTARGAAARVRRVVA